MSREREQSFSRNRPSGGPPARRSTANSAVREESVDLSGVVERIVFSNSGTSFCVAELRGDSNELVTIKGVMPGLQCGETLWVHGHWESHPQFGRQVFVEKHEVRLPASVQGIRKFLGSGLIPGIGKGYADRIVDKFGEDTLRILSEESGRLREIRGIGGERLTKIKAAWDEQRALREVMLFLQTYGVGVRQCMRIVRRYGSSAPGLLKSDPYRLAREVDGIGFKTADRIALNLGLANDSPSRLDAGLMYAMQTAEATGNTALPFDGLVTEAAQLLHATKERLTERLELLLKQRDLTSLSTLVQLPFTARDEQRTAEALLALRDAASGLPPIKVPAAVEWAQQRAGFSFAPEQAEAVALALENKICVITGGPGTGKTSILRALVSILQAKKLKVLLASPTGRAAQRLAESAGMEAATLHRLLRYNGQSGGFDVGAESPLTADAVIIDESSMLDARLASALLQGMPPAAHLVLVGDADQLPSVGAGNVLADVIASGVVPVVRLRHVFRQSEGSAIVQAAHDILRGEAQPPALLQDVRELARGLPELAFLQARDAEDARQLVVEAAGYLHSHCRKILRWQVLPPMHRGQCGIQALNPSLQEALNRQGGEEVYSGEQKFRVGDKVIQTRNDYDKGVFNGDIGIVTACTPSDGSVNVRFAENEVSFARMELVDLQIAYAISIHKSQGSEFDFVIIPLLKQHFMLLQRNLLYTALTRAKKGALIIGEVDAYRMAVQRIDASQRTTTLRARLLRLESATR